MSNHAWSGERDPSKTSHLLEIMRQLSACETFSVGVYEVVQKAGGKGTKRGKVKVRVSGPTSCLNEVHAKASEIAAQLDAGTYTGPKNVRVKR